MRPMRAPPIPRWLGALALALALALSLLLALLAAGCATTIPPRPAVLPAAPASAQSGTAGMRVEKTREELQLAPWDLSFSAVRGVGQVSERVTARNLTNDPVMVRALPVLGDGAAQFQLRDAPQLPTSVPAKGQLSVGVTFAPQATATLGVHRALLRFQTGPSPEDGPGTDLSGLATLGRAGDSEPSLADVVEALGYAVDVGRAPARPIGDEISMPLFTRATPTPVALNPVARFSADGPRPFGPYKIKTATATATAAAETLATLAAGQHQTLNPELESDGNASFDPGDAVFGLWVKVGKRTIYTEDQRNGGAHKHAARVFPLHARGGAPVANAYLVAFRDAGDDAFQDYVFVIWNVKPPAGALTAPASRSP